MTWIKPSFLWMTYGCGWATKEGQETDLVVEISREGFSWALNNAELSHYVGGVHPDRATWQRNLRRSPPASSRTPNAISTTTRSRTDRSNSGSAAKRRGRYADERTVPIRDVTPLGREVHAQVRAGRLDEAAALLLPAESPYLTDVTPPTG
ncbi:DUF4291 family protein [Streptomyces sp. NPDC005498]|uniref:DUF4291 family protein n=1 Tax=Streptomyces sp. NPDC005498 TaxID=3364717 RepID=UPI0036AFD76C